MFLNTKPDANPPIFGTSQLFIFGDTFELFNIRALYTQLENEETVAYDTDNLFT